MKSNPSSAAFVFYLYENNCFCFYLEIVLVWIQFAIFSISLSIHAQQYKLAADHMRPHVIVQIKVEA